MVLVIDNYDSFTYNLVELIESKRESYDIYRNDKITVEKIELLQPKGILISPGPGRPEAAGICIELINRLGLSIPILGVCLGHQAIGYAFECQIIAASELLHGKTSLIYHDGKTIYQNVENPFEAMRYHSLVIDRVSLSDQLIITAETEDHTIMGIRHKKYPIEGIQFHPESILTKVGRKIIYNWLEKINIIF